MGRTLRSSWAALLTLLLFPAAAHAVTVPTDFRTIQAAINAVVAGTLPSGTVIDVRPGTYFEALTVANTSRSFTVRSLAGPGSTVINATGKGRTAILIASATGAIRFDGFTIAGGLGGQNAAIGGGLTIQSSSPTFANCIIRGNRSLIHGGGAALARSNALFAGVTFQGNVANNFGGGVFIGFSSNPTFVGATITGNTSGATATNGAGGGVGIVDASATFRSSSITSNRSKFAAGGIFALTHLTFPATTTLVLEDSDVIANTALRATGAPPTLGGGIHIEDKVIARVTRTRVRGNVADGGAGLSTFRARYEVTGSMVESNVGGSISGARGGGIIGSSSSGRTSTIIVTDSVVRNNTVREGGGIWISGDPTTTARATLTVSRSLIDRNVATTRFGGGIHASRALVTVTDSQIFRNRVAATGTESVGGGLFLLTSVTTLTRTTVAGNAATFLGGGIYVNAGGSLAVSESRIYRNVASGFSGARGGGMHVGTSGGTPTGTIQQSILADNTNFEISETACPVLAFLNNIVTPAAPGGPVYRGSCGNLTVDGLNALPNTAGNTSDPPVFASFAATPDAAAAGRPAVLAWSVGRASSITITGVGTFSGPDVPTGSRDVDPGCPASFALAADTFPGPVAAPVARTPSLTVFGPGFFPYASTFMGGVSVAAGDVDGDGLAEVVTGPGSGLAPQVRLVRIDAAGGAHAFGSAFLAYPSTFTGGVFVAAGDVDGDGLAEVVTGPGSGLAPQVKIFKVGPTGTVTQLGAGFLPYPSTFRGGVRVAVADVDGDGRDEIITAPGAGMAPQVRVFKISNTGVATPIAAWLAYPSTFLGGVFVAAGDADNDPTRAEVVTAPGAGLALPVKSFRVEAGSGTPLNGGFFAYPTSFRGGVSVAGRDLQPSPGAHIVTGPGSDNTPDVRVFNLGGSPLAQSLAYRRDFGGGVRVAAGNVDGTSPAVITGPGPGTGPLVRIFKVPSCPVVP